MWHYVFFLIYIFEKDRTKFTGTEQYIYEMASSKNMAFFPVLRSLELEQVEHKEKSTVTEIHDEEESLPITSQSEL